jgi:hypothetical protein
MKAMVFAEIEARAAAEGDDAVMAAVFVRRYPGGRGFPLFGLGSTSAEQRPRPGPAPSIMSKACCAIRQSWPSRGP